MLQPSMSAPVSGCDVRAGCVRRGSVLVAPSLVVPALRQAEQLSSPSGSSSTPSSSSMTPNIPHACPCSSSTRSLTPNRSESEDEAQNPAQNPLGWSAVDWTDTTWVVIESEGGPGETLWWLRAVHGVEKRMEVSVVHRLRGWARLTAALARSFFSSQPAGDRAPVTRRT